MVFLLRFAGFVVGVTAGGFCLDGLLEVEGLLAVVCFLGVTGLLAVVCFFGVAGLLDAGVLLEGLPLLRPVGPLDNNSGASGMSSSALGCASGVID